MTAGIFILFEAEEIVAVVLVIQQLVLIIVMSRFGEAALRKMLGGKPIFRNEHIVNLQIPFEKTLAACRESGLDLPENITPYVIQSETPFAYAVGKHAMILSEGMGDVNEDVFDAIIEHQLYQISKRDPDTCLLLIGCNLVISCIALSIMAIAGFFALFGSYSVDIFGDIHSEKENGALVLIITGGMLMVLMIAKIEVYKHAVKKHIFEADEFVVRCGHGEAQILYIDYIRLSGSDKWNPVESIRLYIRPDADSRIAQIERLMA